MKKIVLSLLYFKF